MHSILHYGIKMVMERFWLHVLKNSHREFQRLKVSFLNTLFKSVIILLMQLMFRFHMLNFQQHKSPIRTQLFFLVSTSCFFGGENCCCYVCSCRRCTCWSCDLKLIWILNRFPSEDMQIFFMAFITQRVPKTQSKFSNHSF